jgi:hypothetical protein
LAQNALDRPLQQDLRVNGAAGYNRPDFASEVRLRNALVTGNVGGGKSLQIAQPYSGPGDFHGSLGTDSLFAFRRDSFGYSDGNTFRNSDALTFQTLYSTGNSRAQPTVLSRFGAFGAPPSTGATAVASDLPNGFSNLRASSPNDSLPPGSLRSTGEYISTRSLNPTLIGFQQTREGESRITASSPLGVRSDLSNPAQDQLSQGAGTSPKPTNSASPNAIDTSAQAKPDDSYQTAYDLLRERLNANVIDTSVNVAPKPGDTTTATPNTPSTPTTPASGDRPGPTTTPNTKPTDSTTPATRPNSNGAPNTDPVSPANPSPAGGTTPSSLPGSIAANTPNPADANLLPWERRMRDLRNILEATPEPAPKAGAPGFETEPTEQQKALGLDTPDKVRTARAGLDDETLAILRTTPPKFSTYLSGEPRPGDLYAEQLFNGQKSLAEGRYFDAEERFASAAAMRPGDVTALVGRINSQLGAGLYVSAAVNLRSLYTRHPEVIGLRFSGAAVPKIERMTGLMVDLRTQIARAKTDGVTPRAESAFLLAYVGYQLENVDAVRDGLAEARAVAAQIGQPEPLQDVLEAVWLYHNTSAIPAPSKTPAPSPSK